MTSYFIFVFREMLLTGMMILHSIKSAKFSVTLVLAHPEFHNKIYGAGKMAVMDEAEA